MPFEPKEVYLTAIINENIVMLKHQGREKGVELEFKSDTDAIVFCDENMLNTVIRNLTSNAIKFTPSGGTVTFKVSRDEKVACLEISDTGVGMSKKQVEILFEIDKNKSTKGTNAEPGTGLGLVLCKEFVVKNSGKIWAESEEGNGSTFFIELPLRQ